MRVGDGGTVAGLEINAGMLAVTEQTAAEAELPIESSMAPPLLSSRCIEFSPDWSYE